MVDTDDKLKDIENALRSQPRDRARALIEKALPSLTSAAECISLARTCEKHGHVAFAVSAYNRALELEPDNPDALWGLALLRIDMGMPDRARRCLERLDAASDPRARELLDSLEPKPDGPDNRPDPPAGAAAAKAAPSGYTDADLVLFCELFSGRQGVHARQWSNGERHGYAPVMAPLTPALVRQHLLGTCTLGVYPLDRANRVRFLAVDVDCDAEREQLAEFEWKELVAQALGCAGKIARRARELGFEPLLEWSGNRGYHVWVLFAEPWPAARARRLAKALAAAAEPLPAQIHIDVFPAQSSTRRGGLGNLIKLPLGVHLKSGERSAFVDEEGNALDPWPVLRAMEPVAADTLEAALRQATAEAEQRAWEAFSEAGAEPAPRQPPDEAAPEPAARAASAVPCDPPYDPEADEQLQFLLERCRTLKRLVDHALSGGPLDHGAQKVIRHTLGHLERGPDAVNLLFERAGCLDEAVLMKNRLRGMPASCRKIRQHLGMDTEAGCSCPFDRTLGHYPTPLLHLAALEAERKIVELDATGPDAMRARREYRRVVAELERLRNIATELERAGAADPPSVAADGVAENTKGASEGDESGGAAEG